MDADALRRHLADYDAPCPACGYNLRGLTGAACPECGTALRLVRAADQIDVRALVRIESTVLAFGALFGAATLGGLATRMPLALGVGSVAAGVGLLALAAWLLRQGWTGRARRLRRAKAMTVEAAPVAGNEAGA